MQQDYTVPMVPTKRVTTCSHYRQPLVVGNHTIYLSGWNHTPTNEHFLNSNLFIQLDPIWLGETSSVYSSSWHLPLEVATCPSVLVDWADAKDVPESTIDLLLSQAMPLILNNKHVDIACLGGHGRTGTLAAILIGLIENVSAYKAITTLRKRYCKRAVESRTQVNFIYSYLDHSTPSPQELNKLCPIPVVTTKFVNGIPVVTINGKEIKDWTDQWQGYRFD